MRSNGEKRLRRSPESCYRGDYARVTTPERNITIKLTHDEFAILDARAQKENITRTALARNVVLEALILAQRRRNRRIGRRRVGGGAVSV
jgi:hypothetical protein